MTVRLGGWWRLWIVGSALYGVIVATLTWDTFPQVETIPYDESQLKLLSNETRAILRGLDQPSATAKEFGFAADLKVLEMPNGHRFEVVSTTTQEQADQVARDYVRALQSIANEQRLSSLGHGLALWVIPCLIILALGFAARWVYRGFKRSDYEP